VIQQIHKAGEILIGRYQVKRFLAEGGMQEVYVAVDLSFNREVALKVPKHPSAEKRFARSARMSAKVIHANVAQTLDYFSEGGRDHLIEELIQGSNLQDRLDNEFDYLDPHLAAHLIHHLIRAIAVCHRVNVFHRDLKPSNIMVSMDHSMSFMKVTDFGIAKMAAQEIANNVKSDSISASRTVLGAIPYMAPEVVRREKGAGLPADIWSVGALLYRLMSGKTPFGEGLAAVETILKCQLPPKPLMFSGRGQFTGLVDELWEIVTACLRTDPGARPTADQLIKTCSALCYSDASRRAGIVTSYRRGSGDWGFIHADAGDDVFFHSDSYYGPKPEERKRVCFACCTGSPSHRAHPVLPLKPLLISQAADAAWVADPTGP
jgi:serine/threonine-protein kinase